MKPIRHPWLNLDEDFVPSPKQTWHFIKRLTCWRAGNPCLQRISPIVAPHPRVIGVTTTRLVPTGEDQSTAFGVAGVKWNVSGTWLVHANVLVPMTDSGLTTTVTPTLALDYSFGR